MKKVSFYTLGCRLNQSETALLESLFREKGFKVVDIKSSSDIVVINTCTVTAAGDADARRVLNKAIRLNPDVAAAVIGCQAQVQKEKILAWPNVRWVVGTARKLALPEIILDGLKTLDKELVIAPIRRENFVLPLTKGGSSRARANLKVQDGCDNFCAYCEIPYARGRARSRRFDNILDEARMLAAAGHQEIVLTGINVGLYSDQGKNLVDVVKALEKIQGLLRIRISSIEQTGLIAQLTALMKPPHKLCRFLHVPLQHGSDRMLRKMGRKYTAAQFSGVVEQAERDVPGLMVGTDVIVGFPGETEEDFEQMRLLLMRLPIHYFHVFRYSPRERARSRLFKGVVPDAVVSRRAEILRKISLEKYREFLGRMVGSCAGVIFEQKKNNQWIGHADNYVTIKMYSDEDLKNAFVPVVIEKVDGQILTGSVQAGAFYATQAENRRAYPLP